MGRSEATASSRRKPRHPCPGCAQVRAAGLPTPRLATRCSTGCDLEAQPEPVEKPRGEGRKTGACTCYTWVLLAKQNSAQEIWRTLTRATGGPDGNLWGPAGSSRSCCVLPVCLRPQCGSEQTPSCSPLPCSLPPLREKECAEEKIFSENSKQPHNPTCLKVSSLCGCPAGNPPPSTQGPFSLSSPERCLPGTEQGAAPGALPAFPSRPSGPRELARGGKLPFCPSFIRRAPKPGWWERARQRSPSPPGLGPEKPSPI